MLYINTERLQMRKCTKKNCNKIFDNISDLKRHMKTCGVQYECMYCDKIYKREKYFQKHQEKCYINFKNIERKVNTHNNQNYYDNSVTNYNQQKIIINNHFQFSVPDNPNIDHITKERILQICKKPFPNMIRELMRLTYFDKNTPKNMQWCVQYPKETYGALKFNHDSNMLEKWVTKKIINVSFENMINKIEPVVSQIIGDKTLYPSLSQRQKDNLNLFFRYFGINDLSTNNPSQFEDIKMMAFSNKTVPLGLWKQLSLNIH